jgi:hypothetical protein
MAGGQGFEPRLMEPESIVLPLDDPPSPKLHSAQDKTHSVVIFNINDTIEKVKRIIFKRSLSEPPLSFSSILLRRQSNLLNHWALRDGPDMIYDETE